MSIRRVILVGDGANPRVRAGFDALRPWLEQRVEIASTCELRDAPLDPTGADLVIVLGGDGAILATARRLGGGNVPLIGIRLGHFGFLAELEPESCRPQLDRIFAGEGRVVEREMIECQIRLGDGSVIEERALNDAVLTSGSPGRMVALDLEVDGERVATYRGDGLIIATPVGSTAHSLAAGGPVIEPAARSFVVTPLAAHSLASRPLVLDNQRRIVVRRGGTRSEKFAATFDGQRTHRLDARAVVHLARCERPLRVMTIVERTFFETLRLKFAWGGSVGLDPPQDPPRA